MNRVVLALMYSGLLALLTIAAPGLGPSPAVAGDYYDEGYRYDSGYRYERPYRPYYSNYHSNCCYRKVVRYERTYRDYDRPYYRSSYYDRPYYERPYYRSYTSYYDRPSYSYRSYSYPSYRNYSGYDYRYSTRYSSYSDYDDQPRRLYAEGCRPHKYKIYDDAGGWIWGQRTSCW